jgi:hypothetical protein
MPAVTLYLRNLPAGPPGCWQMTEEFPTGAEDATTEHDSCSNCGGGNTGLVLLKPGVARVKTDYVAGSLPPVDAPPLPEHRFGWFSQNAYVGSFPSVFWTLQLRREDNRSQNTGVPVANLYKCTIPDFAQGIWTHLLRVAFTDWWSASLTTQNFIFQPLAFELAGEYLFLQLWDQQGQSDATVRSHKLRVEGTGLNESTVSKLVMPDFSNTDAMLVTCADFIQGQAEIRVPYLLFPSAQVLWTCPYCGDQGWHFVGGVDANARTVVGPLACANGHGVTIVDGVVAQV